jgi:RNA ligase
MIALSDILDQSVLEEQIDAGLITRRFLTGTGIHVLNYTSKAAFKGIWTDETRRCRGLVVGEDGEVLARPFEKFFDLAATPYVPDHGRLLASEKMDGSLGILYAAPDGWRITTRGDPNSWQAEAATAMWHERYDKIEPPEGQTWCFEIILPENRVVVDYGSQRDLVALAAIDTESGHDLGLPEPWPGPAAQRIDASGERLGEMVAEAEAEGNKEGFVLLWTEQQVRAKLKLPAYREMHRLVFSTSTKAIWEALTAGRDPVSEVSATGMGDLVEWVEAVAGSLRERHAAVMREAHATLEGLTADERIDRAAAAAKIMLSSFPGVAFSMLDGRFERAADAAWKLVRPERAEMFRREDESNA